MTETLALVAWPEAVAAEPTRSRAPVAQAKPATIQYVVSCRQALLRKYGPRGFALLDGALAALAQQTSRRQPVAVRVVYADDAASLEPWGIWPATPGDAADFQRVIAALHTIDGATLPAVLLVGGDDIIPFFRWTHPTDGVTLTDAPYAAAGDAMFAPVRAVGRLPDAPTTDVAPLLALVTTATPAHDERPRVAHPLSQWLRPAPAAPAALFGCTADYWKEAAREVFRAVGDANALRVSPPVGPAEMTTPLAGAAFLYFALGGSRHSPDWWGHHDPRLPTNGQPYAVALRPEDLRDGTLAGATVFSTASYAADVTHRAPHASLAWRFLSGQAAGVIAPTGRAYGSLALPLAGADLLARYLVEALGEGERLGAALTLAKVRYAREMLSTYGYLDMEDQQTLLGFTLLGNPALLPAQPLPRPQPSVPDLLPGLDVPGLRCQLRAVPQPLARVALDVQRRAFEHASTHLPHMGDAKTGAARPVLSDGAENAGGSLLDERFRAAHPGQLSANTVFRFSHTVNLSTDVTDPRSAYITVSPRGELLRMVVPR